MADPTPATVPIGSSAPVPNDPKNGSSGPVPNDPPAGANKFGRTSELRLEARARGGATQLGELYFTMPLKVMRPFPLERTELVGSARGASGREALADPAQVMLMSTSAGLMEGDEQLIDLTVRTGAALQMTSQSFDKVHRMRPEGVARRTTHLAVEPGAYLDYRPQPLIPFAGSAFEAATTVELADVTSGLVFEEVLSCGRVARGERFGYRSYQNRVSVRVGGVPVYHDNARFEPERMPMEGMGLFEGYSHLATLLVVSLGISEGAFQAARSYLLDETGVIGAQAGSPAGAREGSEAVAGGITRLASGDVAVRLLGHRAQRLEQVLARVRGLLG